VWRNLCESRVGETLAFVIYMTCEDSVPAIRNAASSCAVKSVPKAKETYYATAEV
jgi:hypothetical protein